jgi:hypothetical protein
MMPVTHAFLRQGSKTKASQTPAPDLKLASRLALGKIRKSLVNVSVRQTDRKLPCPPASTQRCR